MSMDILIVDIDQFNVRNINITTSLETRLDKEYILFIIKRNYFYYDDLHLPKEVYNMVNLIRLNIYNIILSKIEKMIINLRNVHTFIIKDCFIVDKLHPCTIKYTKRNFNIKPLNINKTLTNENYLYNISELLYL